MDNEEKTRAALSALLPLDWQYNAEREVWSGSLGLLGGFQATGNVARDGMCSSTVYIVRPTDGDPDLRATHWLAFIRYVRRTEHIEHYRALLGGRRYGNDTPILALAHMLDDLRCIHAVVREVAALRPDVGAAFLEGS